MKRRFLAILCAILVFAMLFSLSSCVTEEVPIATDEPTEAPTEAPTNKPTEKETKKKVELDLSLYTTYELAEDDEYFKLYGRTSKVEGGISCDFTASGIEFEGNIGGDVTLKLSCDRDTYFTVYIDGVRQTERFFANKNTTELVIASFDEDSKDFHNIRILKQTEPQWSLSVLKSISLKGELDEAPANKELYIEVIGDSITCGYGNLVVNGKTDAGALYQDGTQSYGFMTAEALGADASIVGCSGIGIDKGYTSWSESDFYPQTSYYRNNTENAYDFSIARVPDLVIINLGTNDKSNGSLEDDFKQGVRDLITYVRESYGEDMPIVWVYNMMGEGRFTWTKTVLEAMGGEENGIYYVELEENHGGGKGHPTLEAQKKAAADLTAFIVEKEILTK